MKIQKTLLFLLLMNLGSGSLFAMEQKAAELADLPDELIVAQFEGVIKTAGTIDEALKNLLKLGNINHRLRSILNDQSIINKLGIALRQRFSNEELNKALFATLQERKKEDPALAIKILAAGAVNARDDMGKTALIKAAFIGNLGIVQALIAARADVNARDRTGATALRSAAINRYLKIVQVLLSAEADIDVADNIIGATPLIAAAMSGDKEIVQILLEAGADVKAKNRYGQTAFDWANIRGKPEIARILEEAGARR